MTLQNLISNKLESVTDIKRDELLLWINTYHKVSDRELRLTVASMIESGHKIGTHHSRGYFLIRNESDLDLAIKGLKAPVTKIIQRAKQLYINCGAEFQLNIFSK